MNSHLWAYFWGPAAGDSSFTATAALTRGGATFAASAAFSPGTKTATAALLRGAAEFAAAATFTAPVYDATAALTRGGSEFAASATFAVSTFTATAALTRSAATIAASATFTAPVYSATAALTRGGSEFAATAMFAAAVFQATAALTRGGSEFAASATFTVPVYTAAAALTRGAATFAATATFNLLGFTGPYVVLSHAGIFPPQILAEVYAPTLRAELMEVHESSTSLLRAQLLDELVRPLPKASVTAITVTLYDQESAEIINSRDGTDIKDANSGEHHADLSLSAATKTNPCELTISGHELLTNDLIYLDNVVGMTELNGRVFKIRRISDDVVELIGVDSRRWSTYVSGGDVYTGLLTWQMAALDNIIVGTPAVRTTERHRARLNWTYNSGLPAVGVVDIDVINLAAPTTP